MTRLLARVIFFYYLCTRICKNSIGQAWTINYITNIIN